jgi:hydrogenase maturation protease
VLVLGLGNMLMRDDGVGLTMLEELRERVPDGEDLEFMDGGTQGLALLGRIAGRDALLVLDAIALGAEPGTVHRIDDPFSAAPPRATSAHEANAGELLRAAVLLGDLPLRVVLVGVEPADTKLAMGLTAPVAAAVPAAVTLATEVLTRLRAASAGEVEPCTR